jgi:hypothetical protein
MMHAWSCTDALEIFVLLPVESLSLAWISREPLERGKIFGVYDSPKPPRGMEAFLSCSIPSFLTRWSFCLSASLLILLNNIFYFGNRTLLLTKQQYTPLRNKNSVFLFTAALISPIDFLH